MATLAKIARLGAKRQAESDAIFREFTEALMRGVAVIPQEKPSYSVAAVAVRMAVSDWKGQ